MYKYAPFLKFKQNEIQAIFSLGDDIHPFTLPLFDIPKEKIEDLEEDIIKRIAKGAKQLAGHAKKIPKLNFFIDNHDLDDSVSISGGHQYRYILDQLKSYNIIPIIAFDRIADHNKAALDYCRQGQEKIGIRLQFEDFQSYTLLKPKLAQVWADANTAGITTSYVIFDCRLIGNALRADELKDAIEKFHTKCVKDFGFTHYIVTGSVIPANITELMGTKSNRMVKRLEDHIWRCLVASPEAENIHYGDYGVVSPEFSEADIPVELMPKFSAPKVFYTTQGEFYAERGGQFSGHPKGYGQYFDIANNIVAKTYYRDHKYSYGDKYIFDRSSLAPKLPEKGGAPGSWIKATLSAHITYVVRER